MSTRTEKCQGRLTVYFEDPFWVGVFERIEKNGINEFFIAGADATGCVKSTCFNMAKAGYTVHVISDCVTSYNLKKLDEMYTYYASKGCEVRELKDYMEK